MAFSLGKLNNSKKKRKKLFDEEDESSDEENGPSNLKEAMSIHIKAQNISNSIISEKSIEEDDPTDELNEYDQYVKEVKSKEEKEHFLSSSNPSDTSIKPKPAAKYVNSLQRASQLRAKQDDRVFERKLLKERAEDEEEFGHLPQFVTSSYKKKLMEDRRWDEEEERAEKFDNQHDVGSLGMTGFYAGLMNRNIAMGGDVEEMSRSGFTVGSKRNKEMIDKNQEKTNEDKEEEETRVEEGDGRGGEGEEGESKVLEMPKSMTIQSKTEEEVEEEKKLKHNEAMNQLKLEQDKAESKKRRVSDAKLRYLERKNKQKKMKL